MAPFNKYIPGAHDDNYLGYSRGVEGPKPNLALAKLFSGVAETADAAIKGGTDWLDIKIEDEARVKAKGLNSDVTDMSLDDAATLGKLKNKVDTGAGSSGTPGAGSWLEEGLKDPKNAGLMWGGEGSIDDPSKGQMRDTPVPLEVQKGTSYLDRLYQRYQAGQLSPTYWMMEQQKTAQQLKARFPGSEKQVDAALHRETQSANEIRRQTFADFQAAATAANSANNRWDATVEKNAEWLGADGVRAARHPSVYGDKQKQTEILAQIATLQQRDQINKSNNLAVEVQLKANSLNVETAESAAMQEANGSVSGMAVSVLGPLSTVRKEMDAAILANKFTPDQVTNWGNQLTLLRQQATEKVNADFNRSREEFGGKSLAQLIRDPAKLDKFRNMALQQLDYMQEALNNNNTGMFKFWANAAERNINAGHLDLLQKSDTYQKLAVLQHGLKGQAGNVIERLITDSVVPGTQEKDPRTGAPIPGTGKKGLQQLWEDMNVKSVTNKATGEGSIADGVKTPPGVALPPQVPKRELKSTVDLITAPDSTPELRKNALKNLVEDVRGDFFKPLDKSSQMNALTALSTSNMIDNIHGLNDPDLWSKYKNWFETNTRNMILMRGGDIRGLVQNKSLMFQYNPDTNQLDWNRNEGAILSRSPDATVNYPELTTTATLMNNLIRNLNTLYTKEGSDAKAQITRQMQSYGIPIAQPTTGTGKRSEGEGSSNVQKTALNTTTGVSLEPAAYAPLPQERPADAQLAISNAVKGTPESILRANLEPGKHESHITGMSKELKTGLAAMLQSAPSDVRDGLEIFSGHRSVERQKELFAAAVDKYGSVAKARHFVAPPGRSMHGVGNAADLRFASSSVRNWFHNNAEKYGLHFPLGHEPWHIEPISARSK